MEEDGEEPRLRGRRRKWLSAELSSPVRDGGSLKQRWVDLPIQHGTFRTASGSLDGRRFKIGQNYLPIVELLDADYKIFPGLDELGRVRKVQVHAVS